MSQNPGAAGGAHRGAVAQVGAACARAAADAVQELPPVPAPVAGVTALAGS